MSDISALESRITAALDRIRLGVDAQSFHGGGTDALNAALENERAANVELIERVRVLKDRQDSQVAALSARVEKQRAQLIAYDAQIQNLRASNSQLREANTLLREAMTEGLAPELVDMAISAEITALQAQRTAEATEIEAILAELKPLIEETPHAAG